mmetsp:Transcript_956/g.2656  ORF Transcript_956/g.2656 Transcript_956/m.2656 type:complete len:1578 (+) Transcript_956:93-4826(+)
MRKLIDGASASFGSLPGFRSSARSSDSPVQGSFEAPSETGAQESQVEEEALQSVADDWTFEERMEYVNTLDIWSAASARNFSIPDVAAHRFLAEVVGLARLPKPWVAARSRKNLRYYKHSVRGETSWRHPLEAALKDIGIVAKEVLPMPTEAREARVKQVHDAWSTEATEAWAKWQMVDSDDGRVYYFNVETNECTWDEPNEVVLLPFKTKMQSIGFLYEETYVLSLLQYAHQQHALAQQQSAAPPPYVQGVATSLPSPAVSCSKAASPASPAAPAAVPAAQPAAHGAAAATAQPAAPERRERLRQQLPAVATSPWGGSNGDESPKGMGIESFGMNSFSQPDIRTKLLQSPGEVSPHLRELAQQASYATFQDSPKVPTEIWMRPTGYGEFLGLKLRGSSPSQVDTSVLEVMKHCLFLNLPAPWKAQKTGNEKIMFVHSGYIPEKKVRRHPLETLHKEIIIQLRKAASPEGKLTAEVSLPRLTNLLKRVAGPDELQSLGAWEIDSEGYARERESGERRKDDLRVAVASHVGTSLFVLRSVWEQVCAVCLDPDSAWEFPLSNEELWVVAAQQGENILRRKSGGKRRPSKESQGPALERLEHSGEFGHTSSQGSRGSEEHHKARARSGGLPPVLPEPEKETEKDPVGAVDKVSAASEDSLAYSSVSAQTGSSRTQPATRGQEPATAARGATAAVPAAAPPVAPPPPSQEPPAMSSQEKPKVFTGEGGKPHPDVESKRRKEAEAKEAAAAAAAEEGRRKQKEGEALRKQKEEEARRKAIEEEVRRKEEEVRRKEEEFRRNKEAERWKEMVAEEDRKRQELLDAAEMKRQQSVAELEAEIKRQQSVTELLQEAEIKRQQSVAELQDAETKRQQSVAELLEEESRKQQKLREAEEMRIQTLVAEEREKKQLALDEKQAQFEELLRKQQLQWETERETMRQQLEELEEERRRKEAEGSVKAKRSEAEEEKHAHQKQEEEEVRRREELEARVGQLEALLCEERRAHSEFRRPEHVQQPGQGGPAQPVHVPMLSPKLQQPLQVTYDYTYQSTAVGQAAWNGAQPHTAMPPPPDPSRAFALSSTQPTLPAVPLASLPMPHALPQPPAQAAATASQCHSRGSQMMEQPAAAVDTRELSAVTAQLECVVESLGQFADKQHAEAPQISGGWSTLDEPSRVADDMKQALKEQHDSLVELCTNTEAKLQSEVASMIQAASTAAESQQAEGKQLHKETLSQLQKAFQRQEVQASEAATTMAMTLQKQVVEQVAQFSDQLAASEKRHLTEMRQQESGHKESQERFQEQLQQLKHSEQAAMEAHRRHEQAMQQRVMETVQGLQTQLTAAEQARAEEADRARSSEANQLKQLKWEREERRIEEQGYWRRLTEFSEKESLLEDEHRRLQFDLQHLRDAEAHRQEEFKRRELEWRLERREIEIKAENRELEWRAECRQMSLDEEESMANRLEAEATQPVGSCGQKSDTVRSRVKGKLHTAVAGAREIQAEKSLLQQMSRPTSAYTKRLAPGSRPVEMAQRRSSDLGVSSSQQRLSKQRAQPHARGQSATSQRLRDRTLSDKTLQGELSQGSQILLSRW